MSIEDDLTQAEYLEQLAASLKRLEGRVDTLDRLRLEELLGNPGSARAGGIGMPEMRAGASDVDRTLGNIAPYFGQTNLLQDPTFELSEDVLLIGTVATGSGVWRTHYTLDAGTAPTTRRWELGLSRSSDYNPFNTIAQELRVSGFASGTTTFYVYPNVGFIADPNSPALPYLVASCRVGDFSNSISVMTNITSCTVTLQIIDAAGNVDGESQPLDFKALASRNPEQQQLVAAIPSGSDTYKWRLKVTVVASGAGGTLRVRVGEPMLHYAYSPDPAPFSPQLGRHYPVAIYWPSVPSSGIGGFIRTKTTGQSTIDLFEITGSGEHKWGDGLGGGFDAYLKRSPNGGLQVGGDVAGGIIDRYDGNDVFNTYVPDIFNGGTVTWTTRRGWWQRIGKMVFVAIELVVNAAGSGASPVEVGIPLEAESTDVALQHVTMWTTGGEGVAVINAGGSTTTFDRLRINGAVVLTGANLSAGARLMIQGWYRAL